MGRAKAKPINCMRGGAMGIAALHPSYELRRSGVFAPLRKRFALVAGNPAEVTHSGRTARNGYFYHSNDAAG